MSEEIRREREERALDALIVLSLRRIDQDDDIPDPDNLPQLTDEENAALNADMNALGTDFASRILAGERPVPPKPETSTRILRDPTVYLVGRQVMDLAALDRFLDDHGVSWRTDTKVGGEQLIETAGRLCYLSFGKPRPGGNSGYIDHLLGVGHGSVLEHAVWNILITGVSRSFTHELVRHRVGFSYSQLSQRYVDESTADFVEPDAIAGDPDLHRVWLDAIEAAQTAYRCLVAGLDAHYQGVTDRTLRRKLARQAARSVLPNATETKVFVTANARALRNFLELRGSEHADVEMRKVALAMLAVLQAESPNVFGDYRVEDRLGAGPCIATDHPRV